MGVTISNIGDGGMQVLPTIYELVQREDYTSPDGKVTKKGEVSGISAMITISTAITIRFNILGSKQHSSVQRH